MIDDFSVSGVNDSCEVHNKIDLHMVDTFSALVKAYFRACNGAGRSSSLLAKTYDLKHAYRQVPIRPSHYKFAFFSVYNHKEGRVQVYRLKTMPFGATHSVYCFLRLARMLYFIATQGLFLLCTNFYDDFVLTSKPELCESSRCSMELVFLLTGWTFAKEGDKATSFGLVCKALGVQFDFSRSESGLMAVSNTENRRQELLQQIRNALASGSLEKQETLALRGRLGFADSFLHGRLGRLVLKNLVDHAYGPTRRLDAVLIQSLRAMAARLSDAKPKVVTAFECKQWFIYTDACFEQTSTTGGLGGVLVDQASNVCAWFGLNLDSAACASLGGTSKGTIIFELELLATVLAASLWCQGDTEALHVFFGDNDGVRFSLIRATCSNELGQRLMEHHLRLEADGGLRTWYARVPTEANISDLPSRDQPHSLLDPAVNISALARQRLDEILQSCCSGEARKQEGE